MNENEIVNRLRDATRAAAGYVDAVPELKRETRKAGARAWLVPVAAAASVMSVLVAGVVVGVNLVEGDGPDAAMPISAGTATTPRFLADLTKTTFRVRTVEGLKETATVPVPSGAEAFERVAGAGDNRTFVVVARSGECAQLFFKITLDEAGKVAGVDRLFTAPADTAVTNLAVTGDGGKVVYGLAPCRGPQKDTRLVMREFGGAERTWRVKNGPVLNLSASHDGKYIAYQEGPRVQPALSAPGVTVPPAEAVPVPSTVPESSSGVAEGSSGQNAESVPVVPKEGAEPADSPSESTGGTSVSPPEGTVEAPLQDRPEPPSITVEASPGAPHTQHGIVYGTQKVFVLDTSAEGEDTGAAKAVDLPTSLERLGNGVHGVRITGDGQRLIYGGSKSDGRAGVLESPGEVLDYSIAEQRVLRVLHSADKGPVHVVDINADGSWMIVRHIRQGFGVVSPDGYRAVASEGDNAW
ncbi:hypothetical protein [Sinosporangium siamense]|uniref:Uncharacterized protein n=1 Tax=Sinosporangium siamense TaxID=1367973 RepID=A0A919RJ32_9ACTN|nr:hypothetical protein [Sinosporangium siamense]GII94738.1 hypothetical protein Ssi02_49690 [Sinosporangium siamense]